MPKFKKFIIIIFTIVTKLLGNQKSRTSKSSGQTKKNYETNSQYCKPPFVKLNYCFIVYNVQNNVD